MPTGTPYLSFVLPYPIRVDDFTFSSHYPLIPALHLLTHAHSDHTNGLASKSFGYTVICSQDTKEMLLRHEVGTERTLHDMKLRVEKTRTFGHLKVDPIRRKDGRVDFHGSRDLLVRGLTSG
jgi:glyoxylase-like metal-dependent hydrolase (beta-lactamase superfamily II)